MMKKFFLMAVMAFTTVFVACKKDNDGNLYNVFVTAGEGGTVAGDNGKHSYGEELTFVAVPNTGYSFSCWSDGVKSNPRTIIVNSDVTLVALFANNNGNNGENNSTNNGENNGTDNNGGNGNNEQNTDNNPYHFTTSCWEGSLPIRENESSNYSSRFYFFDDNGNKYGTEESYYKGSLDNTYDFLWEWADNSHSILILNYGGKWAEDKCYVEILEFNEDHIYGYYYKTPADYMTNRVKVELEHGVLNFDGLTVFANADGTIEFGGLIEANFNLLKEFCVYNADGTIAYDFLKQNEQIKENKSGVKTLNIKSTGKLPVAKYSFAIKTKKGTEISESIGADYSFNVGTGTNEHLGSFFSLIDQRTYMLRDFYNAETGEVNDVAKTIELYLGGEWNGENVSLYSAKNMKVASTTNAVRDQTKADANKAKLADAKVFENVVVTTTNCIATYKLTKIDDKTVEISGVMINSKGNYKIDVSAAFAN